MHGELSVIDNIYGSLVSDYNLVELVDSDGNTIVDSAGNTVCAPMPIAAPMDGTLAGVTQMTGYLSTYETLTA